MKKHLLLIGLIAAVGLIGGWRASSSAAVEPVQPGLIRFHVLANSDSEADQLLKRQVRDAVLAKFSAELGESSSVEASRRLIKQNLKNMEKEAARVIKLKGKDYPVRAEYGYFNFPVKSYGDLTLPAGKYEAVRIIIGEGKGQNWWCVLYPPLCFVDITNSVAHNPGIAKPVLNNNQANQEVKPVIKFKSVEVVKELAQKIKL